MALGGVPGVFVGLGFFAKQGEVLLIIPALLVLLAVVSPRSWKVKLGQSLATVVAMVVSAGWYIVAVALWPSSSRPYIGGSTNNFMWDLTLGDNGFSRLSGNGSAPGDGAGGVPGDGAGQGGSSVSDAAQGAASAVNDGMAQTGSSGQGIPCRKADPPEAAVMVARRFLVNRAFSGCLTSS